MKHLILICLALTVACDETDLIGPIDNGLEVRDGIESHPLGSPVLVACDETMDEEVLLAALDWWGDELSQPTHFGNGLFVETIRPFELAPGGVIVVSIGEAPPDRYSDTVVDRNEEGGILGAAITLQVGEWSTEALRHELGRALGLAEDPPSLELESIMSHPTARGSSVTENDRAAIIPWLSAAGEDDEI